MEVQIVKEQPKRKFKAVVKWLEGPDKDKTSNILLSDNWEVSQLESQDENGATILTFDPKKPPDSLKPDLVEDDIAYIAKWTEKKTTFTRCVILKFSGKYQTVRPNFILLLES